MSARRLPMFPLGTVLVPGQYLPLQVFEPRYRELTRSCLDGDRRFGVVLIERGSEVGGGDERFGVGTVAEIVRAAELPDGRWLVESVGRERLSVERWLPDDPHPWAEVTLLDEPVGDVPSGAVDEVAAAVRRLGALRAELDEPAPPATVELPADPVEASYAATVLAGLNPLDALAVLSTPDAATRLTLLLAHLAEEIEVAQARLGG